MEWRDLRLWRSLAAVILSVFLTVFLSRPVMAAEVPLVYAGTDDVWGNRYQLEGYGGFSSSIKAGETASMASFVIDSGMYWEVTRDGRSYNMSRDDMIFSDGSYELLLAPSKELKDQIYAIFYFQVRPDAELTDLLENLEAAGTVVETEPVLKGVDHNSIYKYEIPTGDVIGISVPLGAVTDQPVLLELRSQNVMCKALKDGVSYEIPAGKRFTEEGQYLVTADYGPLSITESDLHTFRTAVHFRIVKHPVNMADFISAPLGFELEEVTFEGKVMKLESQEWFRPKEDGKYRMIFDGQKDHSIKYTTTLIKDTKVPVLKFQKRISSGKTRAPLSYTVSEDNTEIKAELNGMDMFPVPDTLVRPGRYHITVTDRAGNSQEYMFYLQKEFNLLSTRMLIIYAVVLVGVSLWIIYMKRNLRVL